MQHKQERQLDVAPCANRGAEHPLRLAGAGAAFETLQAIRVDFRRKPMVDYPCAASREKHLPVARHVRIRVGGEKRIVLRPHLAPLCAHMRHRPAPVCQERHVVVSKHFRSRKNSSRHRALVRRIGEHQQLDEHAPCLFAELVDVHVDARLGATFASALHG